MQEQSTTPEEWRPVIGYEGRYEVSDHGRVRSLFGRKFPRRAPRPMSPWLATGYPAVSLSQGAGVIVKHRIHTLVLEAFIGRRPERMECAHWDGDRTNNHLSNLRWATSSENNYDSVILGRSRLGADHWTRKEPQRWERQKQEHKHKMVGEHVNSKLTNLAVLEIRAAYPSGGYRRGDAKKHRRILAERFLVSPATIKRVQLRRSWTHI